LAGTGASFLQGFHYTDYQDRYIIPRFGALRLSEITASRIRVMIAELKSAGLAPNTVRLAVASLRSVLSATVQDDLIPKNPAFARALGKGVISKEPERETRSM